VGSPSGSEIDRFCCERSFREPRSSLKVFFDLNSPHVPHSPGDVTSELSFRFLPFSPDGPFCFLFVDWVRRVPSSLCAAFAPGLLFFLRSHAKGSTFLLIFRGSLKFLLPLCPSQFRLLPMTLPGFEDPLFPPDRVRPPVLLLFIAPMVRAADQYSFISPYKIASPSSGTLLKKPPPHLTAGAGFVCLPHRN